MFTKQIKLWIDFFFSNIKQSSTKGLIFTVAYLSLVLSGVRLRRSAAVEMSTKSAGGAVGLVSSPFPSKKTWLNKF